MGHPGCSNSLPIPSVLVNLSALLLRMTNWTKPRWIHPAHMRAFLQKIAASLSSPVFSFFPVGVSPLLPLGPVVLSQLLAEDAEGGSRVVLGWYHHDWCLPWGNSAHWGSWVWPKKLTPRSGVSCRAFLAVPIEQHPHLLLLSLTPCESAAAAKLRQQIRNSKNFQHSFPILLFRKLLSITLCTENKHERKNSPMPSVVRAKTRIPWALFRSANILP